MDVKECMIIDLNKRGSRDMFITEQVFSIEQDTKGYWRIRFKSSPTVFQYNQARILYLRRPETLDLEQKGLYINKRYIRECIELLRFTNKKYTFYLATYTNGSYQCFDAKEVYVTRTRIDQYENSTWGYLRTLANETGLLVGDEDENILSKQYDLIDLKRDNVPLAYYLGNPNRLSTPPPININSLSIWL